MKRYSKSQREEAKRAMTYSSRKVEDVILHRWQDFAGNKADGWRGND